MWTEFLQKVWRLIVLTVRPNLWQLQLTNWCSHEFVLVFSFCIRIEDHFAVCTTISSGRWKSLTIWRNVFRPKYISCISFSDALGNISDMQVIFPHSHLLSPSEKRIQYLADILRQLLDFSFLIPIYLLVTLVLFLSLTSFWLTNSTTQ